MKRLALLLLLTVAGCTPAPKPLYPDAKIAFHATRVVNVLDVVRDAAIATHDVSPELVTENAARQVVQWHKLALKTIMVSPSGWRPTVKAGLFELVCHPLAAPQLPAPPCTPQLPPDAVTKLYPYVGLALVVINEVQ